MGQLVINSETKFLVIQLRSISLASQFEAIKHGPSPSSQQHISNFSDHYPPKGDHLLITITMVQESHSHGQIACFRNRFLLNQ